MRQNLGKRSLMSNLEIKLKDDTLITSKTDLKGIVTYCNKDFLTYSGFSEREILGKPHNIVRHNHMPKAVFKFLWQEIAKGDEFFAFVKNKSKNGGFFGCLQISLHQETHKEISLAITP